LNIEGIGYELEPLIIVIGNALKTKLTFDLSDFDNAEGEFSILDATNEDKVASFIGKKGINEVEFSPNKTGTFAIVKDDIVLGIIDVVDDLKSADAQGIRDKYLK